MKHMANPRETLMFILIASTLMVIMNFAFRAPEQTSEMKTGEATVEFGQPTPYAAGKNSDEATLSETQLPLTDLAEIALAYELQEQAKAPPHTPIPPGTDLALLAPSKKPPPSPRPTPPEYEPLIVQGSPKIAIIIDDMGVDHKRSNQMIGMDKNLTLSFLPYAPHLDSMAASAQSAGHELMIHMPMQANTSPVSLGPIAVKSGMSRQDVEDNLDQAFASFGGYKGMNNHMGSMMTRDPEVMGWVMQALKKRGLYFVDSKTIGSSVAADVAREYGLKTAERDVFIDHSDDPAAIHKALRHIEELAAARGHVIAIGHPREDTVKALQAWLPDVKKRGFELVPASALLQKPKSSAPKPEITQAKLEPEAGPVIATEPSPVAVKDIEPAAGIYVLPDRHFWEKFTP